MAGSRRSVGGGSIGVIALLLLVFHMQGGDGGAGNTGPTRTCVPPPGDYCHGSQLAYGKCDTTGGDQANIALARRLNNSTKLHTPVVGSNKKKVPIGFGPRFWNSLCKLGMQESKFKKGALNPKSKACSIPQALPCGKMGPTIWVGPGLGDRISALSAEAQLIWMYDYIRSRPKLHDPDGAWRYHLVHNSY
jgi:hypothetical protein